MMKKNFFRLVLLLMLCSIHAAANTRKQMSGEDDQLTSVYQLAKRVLGRQSDRFVFKFEKKNSGEDFFQLSRSGEKIMIKGSDCIALASGLNWYLKNYCNSQFSIIDQHIALPGKLPLPSINQPVQTQFKLRYFFNVCTFSYTMAWWDWKEWERQIDWMAMNGINFPLAITGQEAVWTEVYKELGLTQQQIDDFLVGPAYLPWSWMGNVDGLGGPLPASWIEKHRLLQTKILKRERELGMTPILQAFTGHVPESLRKIYPDAKLHRTGNWSAGFGGTYFLDPSDKLFQRIGKLFIEKQTAMFGTDHYYSADCFNEVNPDSNDAGFLSTMGKSVYQSMAGSDPKAVWVMQAWFLYYSIDNFWKEPQVVALLSAVPDDKMIILDLYGEVHPVWSRQKSFYGKPWIWNVLQNFGGRTAMSGKLRDMSGNLNDVLRSGDKGNFSGIGMAMEYFGNDPAVNEFVMDNTWVEQAPDVHQWLQGYVKDRYGRSNRYASKAWEHILASVYNSNQQTGTYLCERPGFFDPQMAYRTSPIPDYDPKLPGEALNKLLKCSDEFRRLDTYQFDVVNLTRQFISPLAYYWILDLEKAYQKKDLNTFLRIKKRFMDLIQDFDVLLSTRKEYLLGNWLEAAKKWGSNNAERQLYEWNARNLITLWGEKCTEGQYDDLNNYAYRQWAGMFSGYHFVRWNKFFDEVTTAMRKNKNWDRSTFVEWSCDWEKQWSRSTNIFPAMPHGDPIETSRRIYKKYLPMITSRAK